MFKSTAVKSKNQLSKKQSFIMTHHFIPIRMAVSEKKQTENKSVGKDVKKSEL